MVCWKPKDVAKSENDPDGRVRIDIKTTVIVIALDDIVCLL